MKITFSREEVEDIILAEARRRASPDDFNTVAISHDYYKGDWAVVYFDPDKVPDPSSPAPVAEEA